MRADLKPIVLFDAECAFCRRCVDLFEKFYPGRADFQALQTFQKPPSLAALNLLESLTVIDTGGQVYRGARSVFELLATASKWGSVCRWAYLRVPFFAAISERIYTHIARSRTCALE